MSQMQIADPSSTALAAPQDNPVRLAYAPHFSALEPILAASRQIVVTDATQVTQIKAARAARLKLKDLRVAADKTRKSLKEDALRRGREIDGIFNAMMGELEPEEKRLQALEDFAERAEAERIAKLQASRLEELRAYVIDATPYTTLGTMTEPAWNQILTGARLAHEAQTAAQEKAEAERLAQIEKDQAEREAQRAENERLKAEQERVEKERKAEREAAEAARVEAEAKATAERKRIEAEAAKVKAEADAKIKAEQERARAAQAELDHVKAEGEAKAKAEREAKEKAERDEAARAKKAAAAPDVEKVRAFAASLRAMAVPSLSKNAAATEAEIRGGIDRMAKWLDGIAEKF